MVRAPFPNAFRGRRLVNRDRFRAGGSQLERIGLPGLVVAPPDRRSCLRPYLLQEPGFEKLGYGPLRLGALWTRWPNQAMIIARRRSAIRRRPQSAAMRVDDRTADRQSHPHAVW